MQQTGRLLLLIVHLGQLSQLGRSWQLRPQTPHKVFCLIEGTSVPRLVGATVLGTLLGFTAFDDGSILNHPSSHLQVVQSALAADTPSSSTGLADILPIRDRLAAIRSALTGEKVSELRVGDTLVDRLRAVDGLLDGLQKDIYRDTVDWEAVQVYPKIFRAYSPLFTAYTDRAFPANTEIDAALRYALRYEVGGFYSGVTDFERALEKQSQRQAQRAYARISIAFDHYLKAGDLYSTYEGEIFENTDAWARRDVGMINSAELKEASSGSSQLNYIAPSIEAPGLQDEVVLLKGPDKGRIGIVLWIFKDDKFSNNIVVKLDKGDNDHSEVRLYPYSLVAKTTPPEIQFFDDLLAAYVASAISSGIMYPIDTYKTRVQIGKRGIPRRDEGGFPVLWRGVECKFSFAFFLLRVGNARLVVARCLIIFSYLIPSFRRFVSKHTQTPTQRVHCGPKRLCVCCLLWDNKKCTARAHRCDQFSCSIFSSDASRIHRRRHRLHVSRSARGRVEANPDRR